MGRLEDRTVYTDIHGVMGFVRQIDGHEKFKFRYVLKNYNTPDYEPPEILGAGRTETSREAFQELYKEIRHYTLRVLNQREVDDLKSLEGE